MGDRDAIRLVDTSAMRFHLAVQRSRLAVILLIAAVAAVARWTGLVQFDLVGGALLATLGLVSVPVFMALHRRAASARWHDRLAYGWMLLDIGFTCWSIYLIRDSSPLWLVWFLTNTTAAAFAGALSTGLGPDALARYTAELMAFDAAAVGAAATTWLDPAAMTVVVVGPARFAGDDGVEVDVVQSLKDLGHAVEVW